MLESHRPTTIPELLPPRKREALTRTGRAPLTPKLAALVRTSARLLDCHPPQRILG